MQNDTTIDPYEVDRYNQLADTWWDTEGPFWPLHTLNALRVDYILKQLCERFARDKSADKPLRGLSILDVGCGGGILSESMAKLGAEVTAIDIVARNIGVARLHAQASHLEIDYRQQTAADLAATSTQFDVVLNMEVVEHVADLDAFMNDCCALTKPGGTMLVATINRNPISWIVAIFGAEYVLRWLPRGTHRYAMLRKPRELVATLVSRDFDVADTVGVRVNPFTRTMALTSMTTINYMLTAHLPAQ